MSTNSGIAPASTRLPWSPPQTGRTHLSRWRQHSEPDSAGGLVYDLGSHLIDQAVQLFGRPLSVYAEAASRRPGVTVDDDGFIALEHAGGVRSHLWVSAVAALPAARF